MAEHSGGTNWLGLGLLAAGAWVVWEYLSGGFNAPATTSTATAQPGTTSTMNQAGQSTSVSTAPSSTAAPSSTIENVANQLSQMAGTVSASADQWNYYYARAFGQGLDKQYGFNFDSVYGPVGSGGVRPSGTMTALSFLMTAAAALPGGLPGLSGLGSQISHFPGRILPQAGSMAYLNNHPLPYTPSFNLRGFRGLGALVQASGFEKALWAGRTIQSSRVR